MKISFEDGLKHPEFRNPANSEFTAVRLELAIDCDGEPCGLTAYDGDAMPGVQAWHLHLVVSGKEPVAGPRFYPLFTPQLISVE